VKIWCFFDDKDHNVSDGKKAGATSMTTSEGLTWDKFVECLRNLDAKKTGKAPAPKVGEPKLAAASPAAAAAPNGVVPATGTPRPGWRPPAWAARPTGMPAAAPGFNPRLAAAALAAQWGLNKGPSW